MDFVHPIISEFSCYSVKRKLCACCVFFLFFFQINLNSQCLTKTTGQWSSPGIQLYTTDLDGISVMVEVSTPGLSLISNVSTSTTLTELNPSWYSEPVAGNPSLQLRMVWDIINEPPLEDIDDFADDKETGTIRFTFSEPVSCATLHFDRIGGAGARGGAVIGVSNSIEWTVTTPGITLQKPPGTGTDGFIVTSTKFFKEPDLPNTMTEGLATQGATTGAAAGSVKLISSSPITTVEFDWTGIGVEGVGADELEFVVTAKPDCVPIAEIDKTVGDIRVLADGSYEVDYLYVIQNTGDTTLSQISLIDDLRTNLGCAYLAISDLPSVSLTNTSGMSLSPSQNLNYDGSTEVDMFTALDGELQPGDQLLVELTTILNPDCIGVASPLKNEAVLSGQDPFGSIIEGSDEADLYLPRLELTKRADISKFSDPILPGDTIIYRFEICNTGNGAVSNIEVFDPLQTIFIPSFSLSLSPGQCNDTAVRVEYLLTIDDIINGQVTNQARVRGFSENNMQIFDLSDDPNELADEDPDMDGDPDDPTIVRFEPVPAISLTKIANTSEVQNPTRINDPIIYTFEVCNTGSLELLDVQVNDPLISVTGQMINLLPGACNSTSFSGVYLINQADINSGLIKNTATVNGSSVLGDDVAASDSVEVFLNMAPQIELIKHANSRNIQNPTAAGDLIEYTFEVCNTGNVELNNVLVDDPLLSITPFPISLEIGECDETSFSDVYVIRGSNLADGRVVNSASVSAQSPTGIVVMDTSDDGRFEEDGDDDPTVVDLFLCTIDLGQLSPLQDECLNPNETITLSSTLTQTPVYPPAFELFYILTEGQLNRIIAISDVAQFDVQTAGEYSIHVFIAETSNPASSSYFNPALLIPGATFLNDIQDFILANQLCAAIESEGVGSLVSIQPEVNLVNTVTICNSDELLMPTSIQLLDLFESDPVSGVWSEANLGEITSDSVDFTGFLAGEYVFQFISTNAVTPCNNVTSSTIVNVVDCFSECDELICNELLQVSLGDECMLVPSPDQLLESPATGVYTIEYSFESGRPYGIDTLRSDAVGLELTYNISCAGNSCWGRIQVVGNNIPDIVAPCECQNGESPIPACTLWCQTDDQIASILISPDEAYAQFTECGPEILGDINVVRAMTGDLCDPNGEQHTVTYSAKVIQDGRLSEVDILCQTYWVQKFNIDGSDSDFNSGFGFPGDVALDCNYLDDYPDTLEELELGSPASIVWSTEQDSLAYPYYLNSHILIQDSIDILDTQYVEIGQIALDTLVTNETGEWEIITISRKIYDTLVVDLRTPTGLAVHPIVAIQDRSCNLLVSFTDVEFESCGSGKKIVRSWTMVDWCESSIERTANQTIEISDFTPPQIVKRQGDEVIQINTLPEVQIGIDPWACSASFRLPPLDVIDNCDLDPQIIWVTDEGIVEDGFATDLWLDQSPVVLTAYVLDNCDNMTELLLQVNIIDDVAPVVQADTDLLVTLSYGNPGVNQGEAKIFAVDLDEGSHDNGCGEVSITAVRADDWEEIVQNCDGEIVGFSRESSSAVFQTLDLGILTDKNECLYDSTNLKDVVTAPQEFVRFNCDDVNLDIDVILFVTDKAGNQSQTIISVFVDEKSVPSLVCEDIDFSCDDLEENGELDLLPPRIVGGACSNFFLQAEIASERRIEGACGAATIVIEWFLDEDDSGDPTFGDPFCTQIVEVETEGQVLKPETIKWPQHRTGETFEGLNIECDSVGVSFETPQTVSVSEALSCIPEISETEGPVWCDSDCGVVGTSVETDTLFTDDSCMKLVRRWTVIDWCVWDPNSLGQNDDGTDRFVAVEDWAKDNCSSCNEFGPYDSEPVYFRYREDPEETNTFGNQFEVDVDGYYTFDQIIKVVDNDPPIINSPDTIVVEVDISGVEQDSFGICYGRGIISVSGEDYCNQENTSSVLTWTVEVKDDSDNVVSDLVIDDPILGPSVSSGLGAPGDIHYVFWEASDGCGNLARDTTIVVFKDLTAPVALCVSSVSTALNGDNNIVVWASEFNQSSYDNCTSPDNVRFSLNRTGQEPALPSDANFDQANSIEFTCEAAGTSIDVDVWIWDQSGNGGKCQSSITIQDSSEECDIEQASGFRIGGSVSTENNIPIPGAQIQLSASLSEYPKQNTSIESGSYGFDVNPAGQNYSLVVNREDEVINGLSTLDLVLIQRHILGILPLNSPYKIIASDATNDNSVTARDILEFRKIILGISNDLPDNEAWRFIAKAASFVDQETPWPFIEKIEIANLNSDEMENDFIGIKLGDVNQDVNINNSQIAETRHDGRLQIVVENQNVSSGEVFIVPIHMPALKENMYGFQFTLLHQGLTVLDIEDGSLEVSDNQFARFEELTTFSWNDVIEDQPDEALFYLKLQAQEDLVLKDRLEINDQITKSEAYVGTGFTKKYLEITVVESDKSDQISLGQNVPNPMFDTSYIPFYLPKSSHVQFSFYDMLGQLIKQEIVYKTRGNHRFQIELSELDTKGMLFYEMKVDNQVKSGKMLILK